MTILLTLFSAALLAAASPTDVGSILRSLPPPEGLVAADSVAAFPADRVAEHWKSAAEALGRHGTLEGATASYRRAAVDLPLVTIELFRMSDPKGAMEMFTEERTPDSERFYVGSGAAWRKGFFTFWDGPYYGRIVSHLPLEPTVAFAGQVARTLPTESILMPIFRLFPADGRIEKGEEHTVSDFLGIQALKDVWSVRYSDGGGDYVLFLTKNRPPLHATDLTDVGKIATNPTLESPIQLVDLNDGRSLILFYIRMNPYLAGYAGPRPDPERTALIGRWVQALPLEQRGKK